MSLFLLLVQRHFLQMSTVKMYYFYFKGKKVISLNQAPFNLLKWVSNHAQKLIDVYLWTCVLHCGSASPGTKERH